MALQQGCATSSRAQFCSNDLPQLEFGFESALLVLSPYSDGGRSIASGDQRSPDPVPERDRLYWSDWAEGRLRLIQRAMDLLESENRGGLRKELSLMADELVVFHGYSSNGRLDRMASSVRKLQTISRRVQAKGCTQRPSKKS